MTTVNSIQKKSLPAFSKLLFLLHILLSIYTLLAYLCVYIPPARFWPAGFISLSIPIVLLGHFFLFIYWLLQAPSKALLPLVVVVLGFPLHKRTLSLHFNNPEPIPEQSFKVLSYNARMFNLYEEKKKFRSNEIISWVTENDADIKCIQEFYNRDNSKIFNTITKISAKSEYRYYMTPLFEGLSNKRGFLGVAIFSKYPIVGYGDIDFGKRNLNKGVYADIKIKKDTVRIFNVHLHSMSIRTDSLFTIDDYANFKENYLDAVRRLKRGFVTRDHQISMLADHIKASPHPVIVCGDFNDVPYSYTYQKMRNMLNNAFEEAGRGFGFTYNGKIFFLRIDNQFVDEQLKVIDFRTHRNVPFSDHFPISATYSLAKDTSRVEPL
ncbi:endonuclease/exonuclease/phosphatase family protein [Rhodocytophaga aerolata]|uniref:Endonuclease/exonuclease/phosphatase family protein n=1 Tax=Rhodocytophaga aerolata TaxID=455078 RepID=A0ABT8R4I0_9BACT|nr:endonuclease/exonuclease/phosphatase family protein [Rhodocytophaga aerolata]MDO1446304.1 endonuclease/exonuclease/phosphatase family protein [Rhodocytophaga aerolata]